MATRELDIDKSELFSLIDANLTDEGIMSWERVNACSNAYVILGLIATGVDPAAYGEGGSVNLVEALLRFEKDGAFSNYEDQELDLAFATPQAFSALVAYKIFLETHQSFLLFDNHFSK